MTSTELAVYTPTLHEQMDFAKAVVVRPEGGARSLLPEAYRENPANVLLAVGLGAGMGLSPAESLYRIDVIQGKPCASAELIAANVRKAGHKLRVSSDEQTQSVTATIIRADDPDYPFTLTRDMAWAQRMGLSSKDNYKKQPMTMLQWRAISGVARLACPEALYGVAYTADEIGDMPERSGGLAAALADTTHTAEQVSDGSDGPLPDLPESAYGPDAEPLPAPLNTSSALAKRMFATFNEAGITEREDRLKYVSDVVGREVASSSEMTEADASAVIDALAADLETPFPKEES